LRRWDQSSLNVTEHVRVENWLQAHGINKLQHGTKAKREVFGLSVADLIAARYSSARSARSTLVPHGGQAFLRGARRAN
jgi:hypothetical protein